MKFIRCNFDGQVGIDVAHRVGNSINNSTRQAAKKASSDIANG